MSENVGTNVEATHLVEAKALSVSLYEVLAEDAGWRHSPAHDGWISDDFQDNPDEGSDGYEVQASAEDVCFCCDEVVGGDEASRLAGAAERYARKLDEAATFLKGIEWWNNRWADSCPVCEELQKKGHAPDCKLAELLASIEAGS